MKRFKIALYCLSILIPAVFFVTAGCLMPSPNLTGRPGGTSGPSGPSGPGGTTNPARGCFPGSNSQIRSDIFYYVNLERQRNGLSKLTCDVNVSYTAQSHAEDMARRNYFNHVSPEGSTHATRLDNAGIRFALAGENIAWGLNSGREVVAKWMNSPGHKANILRRDFTAMGIGAYNKYYVLVLIKK